MLLGVAHIPSKLETSSDGGVSGEGRDINGVTACPSSLKLPLNVFLTRLKQGNFVTAFQLVYDFYSILILRYHHYEYSYHTNMVLEVVIIVVMPPHERYTNIQLG